MLTINELNDLFSKVQNNDSLHDVKVLNKISLWSLIKPVLYEKAIISIFSKNESKKNNKYFKKQILLYTIPRYLKTIIKFKFGLYKKTSEILMFVNVRSYYKKDSKIVFKFSDSIITSNNKNKFFLIHNDKGANYDSNFMNFPDFQSNIFRFPPTLYVSKNKRNELSKLLNELSRILEIELTHLKVSAEERRIILNILHGKAIINRVLNFVNEYKRFIKFLHKHKTKLIYLTNSQSHPGIILASKENSIPVVELQHGLITRNHRVYDWPRSYRNSINLMPDYLFVWGDFWKQELLKNNSYWNDSNVISVGNPSFDISSNLDNVKYSNESLDSNLKTILVSSNQIVSKSFANYFIEMFDEEFLKDFQIIYKLHPKESFSTLHQKLKEIYCEKIHFPNIDISFNSLVQISDIHISTFSVTIFETIANGLDTYVINIQGSSDILKSFDNFNFNIIELNSNVFHQLVNRASINNTIDNKMFFCQNSFENIENNLIKIAKI